MAGSPADLLFPDLPSGRLRPDQFYQRDEFPVSSQGLGDMAAINLEADGTTPVEPAEFYLGREDLGWDHINAPYTPPTPVLFHGFANGSTTVTNASTGTIGATAQVDTASAWSTPMYTIPSDGYYRIFFSAKVETLGGTGFARIELELNGSVITNWWEDEEFGVSAGDTLYVGSAIVELEAADEIQFLLTNVDVAAGVRCVDQVYINIEKVG